MKYFIIVFILFSLSFFSNAQSSVAYLELGAGSGNYQEFKISMNYISQQRYTFQIGFSHMWKKGESTPEDFGKYNCLFYIFSPTPCDKQYSFEFLMGRLIPFKADKNKRVNLKMGVGFSKLQTPINWEKSPNGFFKYPYIFDFEDDYLLTFIIEPVIEVPFWKMIDLSIAPFFKVNTKRLALGFRLNLIVRI